MIFKWHQYLPVRMVSSGWWVDQIYQSKGKQLERHKSWTKITAQNLMKSNYRINLMISVGLVYKIMRWCFTDYYQRHQRHFTKIISANLCVRETDSSFRTTIHDYFFPCDIHLSEGTKYGHHFQAQEICK